MGAAASIIWTFLSAPYGPSGRHSLSYDPPDSSGGPVSGRARTNALCRVLRDRHSATATVAVVIDASEPTGSRAWARRYAVLAVAALLCVLAARILGPSDAWDQTQQTTIAYTTDMLVNGRWVVPADRNGKPATKPPLYNWMAAPAVAASGYSSELAHKLPSVIGLGLCFVAVVVLVLYGGLIFGVLPLQGFVSWEGHLTGMLAGILYARINRRGRLPQAAGR